MLESGRREEQPHVYPTNSLLVDAQQQSTMRGVRRRASRKSADHTRFHQMVRDVGGEAVGPGILQGVAGSNPVSPTDRTAGEGPFPITRDGPFPFPPGARGPSRGLTDQDLQRPRLPRPERLLGQVPVDVHRRADRQVRWLAVSDLIDEAARTALSAVNSAQMAGGAVPVVLLECACAWGRPLYPPSAAVAGPAAEAFRTPLDASDGVGSHRRQTRSREGTCGAAISWSCRRLSEALAGDCCSAHMSTAKVTARAPHGSGAPVPSIDAGLAVVRPGDVDPGSLRTLEACMPRTWRLR